MDIKELTRMHEQYLASVKGNYQCDFNEFSDWVESDANYAENYIEIPSNETLSGHAVILDW